MKLNWWFPVSASPSYKNVSLPFDTLFISLKQNMFRVCVCVCVPATQCYTLCNMIIVIGIRTAIYQSRLHRQHLTSNRLTD